MKKPEANNNLTKKQIEDKIAARKAELRELVQHHQAVTQQYNQIAQANQTKANHLEGMLLALKELLAKPEKEKKPKE